MTPEPGTTLQSALRDLQTSPGGLSTEEAQRRLAEYGPNLLQAARGPTPVAMFLRQFADVMILILLAAAAISGVISDVKDTVVIVAVVLLNAILGFIQEYRAERTMQALKALAPPMAALIRDGNRVQISAENIVSGDIVLLEAGQIVPADLRLVESESLRVDESMLTGESVTVEKSAAFSPGESMPALERKDLVFKGTVVTQGRGVAAAVATGMRTELGKIAAMLQGADQVKTPLQRRLADFGRRLALIALFICAMVFVAGILRGEPPFLMFMTAVSLAVAAIPEALPAVVAITLALGAGRMAKRQALIRKLPAVETLGSVTYICTDKTGTLTANRMRAEEAYCDEEMSSTFRRGGAWELLLHAMALSNDAQSDGSGQVLGDPTEVALFTAAAGAGVSKDVLEKDYPRVGEIPFDSIRKRMTTIHRAPGGGFVSFTKGASEELLNRSTAIETAAGEIVLPDVEASLQGTADEMAAKGLRVLAFGMRRWNQLPAADAETTEQDLTLLGFVGLIDPPREEAREAVRLCKAAGIVPVMITGDHPITAQAIARRLGILETDEGVLRGSELAALPAEEFERRVADIRVYARVAPEQKLMIVRALQAKGETVCMTGDGVNDSPALKQADIGVSMGLGGTDVAKEASSMILLDDNFATIVRAVEEGRKIYDNIRRFVKYVLTTNSAEVWTVLLAPMLGMPIPLLPIHILWINLMTDGLPGLALAAEPAEPDLMQRKPRLRDESIFADGLGFHAVWVGILMAGITLLTEALFHHESGAHWQTVVFTVLCLSQLGHVMAIRSERASLFSQGLFSNKPLALAVGATALAQIAIVYTPFFNRLLRTEPMTANELGFALLAASVVFFAVEAEKWLKRRFQNRLSSARQALG